MIRHLKYIAVLLAVLSGALWHVIVHAQENALLKYINARYNYELLYPNFMLPQGESLKGEGQRFKGKNALLIVYGSFYPNLDVHQAKNQTNLLDELNDGAAAIDQQGFHIIDKSIDNNSFSITGADKEEKVYVKKLLITPCKLHLYLWVYYPKADAPYWEKMLPIISHSFRYAGKTCQGDYRNTP